MENHTNIVSVNVSRENAGHRLPFDKLYFFHKDHRDLIPKVFKYALVMPLDDTLKQAIIQLIPKEIARHKQHRTENLRTATGLDGRRHHRSVMQDWWIQNIWIPENFDDRVVVVPILTSRRTDKLLPKYLTSSKWFSTQAASKRQRSRPRIVTLLRPAISEQAYLATPAAPPNDKIRPLCTLCSRSLLALQGKCIPGLYVCYANLDLSLAGDPPCQPITAQP